MNTIPVRRALAFSLALAAYIGTTVAGPLEAQCCGYHVSLDASALATSDAAPFTLEFQLTSGVALDGNRTQATLENFAFGGGSATGIPTVVGGASGDLATGIALQTSSFLNDFQQGFIPQGILEFDLCLMTTAANPPRDPADGFSFAILDNTGTEIPTLGFFDIGSDVLISVDLTGAGKPLVLTYPTDDSVPPAGGTTPIVMGAPVVTETGACSVPEPGIVCLLAGLLITATMSLIRRR